MRSKKKRAKKTIEVNRILREFPKNLNLLRDCLQNLLLVRKIKSLIFSFSLIFLIDHKNLKMPRA